MTLEHMTHSERRKATRAFPVLISAPQSSGKTYAMEQLSVEDKSRTVYVCFETKHLPNDDWSDYRTVIMIKPPGVIPPERAHLYTNYDNIKFKTPEEMKIQIAATFASDLVDRIVLDSTTSMHSILERHYVVVSKNFTVWTMYAQEILEWLAIIKENTMHFGKLSYMIGHTVPARNSTSDDISPYVQIKGSVFPIGSYEGNFNTCLTMEDHKFIADNDNSYDPTRIAASLSPYESETNSLAIVEEDLIGLYIKPKEA